MQKKRKKLICEHKKLIDRCKSIDVALAFDNIKKSTFGRLT
jgi:hypothetical protein